MNTVEKFLEDISYNTKYTFLDEGKNKDEMKKVAKKARLKLPCRDLAIFKGTYAYVDRQNKNGCTLPKEEVEKALDSLRGKAVDFDHFRKRTVGHWIEAELVDDTLIAYGVFFKGNFEEDYKDVKELMEKETLGVSFEAWGDKEMLTAETYNLNDIEFAGGALLMQSEPAFDGAEVLEMAKERVLEFASVMIKPKKFIYSEKVEKGVKEELEEAYSCTCIKCDYSTNSGDTHCKDLKCPKCGGTMRRAERPGPGQPASKATEENKEDAAFPPEVTKCVATKTKAGTNPVQAVKECWAEYKKENKGQITKLPEESSYYVWDVEAILKALVEVECPECKEKGMINVEMIDFAENKVRVKCVCEAILNVDLTPSVKLQKKARKVKSISMEDKKEESKIIEKNWLEIFETSDSSVDEIEEAFMNEVEYSTDELQEGKKITSKERKNISDKMFTVVKLVASKNTGKPRKIRMFPIHDPVHVRNALDKLPQVAKILKTLGVSTENVRTKILNRARELNMKDLLEKYEKSTVEEQSKLFQTVVEENAKLKIDAETKITEVATLIETATTKDEEMATLKTELETVKTDAEEAKAEIAKRDTEIKDAEIAKRREILGDVAKDMSDDDIMNEDKFKIANLEKENAELKVKAEKTDTKKDPEKADTAKEDADLDKGSKDKSKNDEIISAQKRIDAKAWGSDTKETE